MCHSIINCRAPDCTETCYSQHHQSLSNYFNFFSTSKYFYLLSICPGTETERYRTLITQLNEMLCINYLKRRANMIK